jgi:uncharacterized membrane protein YccC
VQVFQDPNRINLRKAARATLVVPGVFAVLVAAGNPASALFGAFGAFSAVVFSDFGGPRRRRFGAYLAAAVVGGVLLALGTALDDTTAAAVVVTLFVAFAVSLLGALGGYFTASVTTVTLAFVLAVMTPGVEADLFSRELGWVVGVVVAGLSAVLLWPVHQRDRVRVAAAAVLRETAACLRVDAGARDLTALRAAHDALEQRAGVVYRPSGSITKEHALVSLVVATRRLLHLVHLVTAAEASVAADELPEYMALRTVVADTLDASAGVLLHERAGLVDVDALRAARDAHGAALEHWATGCLSQAGATAVIDRFTATFPLRRMSLAAVQVAVAADEAAARPARALAETWNGATSVVRAHCRPRSVRFRNAARAGLGLAIAVWVAQVSSVEHAFWVVLGALSVLRSNALGTGATALQALLGALFGFGVASLVIEVLGGDDTWLWIVLPVAVFFAAYTPGAVNFVVGQAAFTVFVVILFNLLVPEGWRTGLVRVQDIAIGAGISVAVGALLWPRGARGVARRSFAELLRAGRDHLTLAFDVAMRGADGDVVAAAARAEDARTRAVAALEDLALEHGGGHVDRQGWSTLLVDALFLQVAADGIVRSHGVHGSPPACAPALAVLGAERDAVAVGVGEEADHLVRDGIRALEPARPPVTPVPPEVGACLTAHAGDEVHAAVGLIWIHEWLALSATHSRVD